MPDNQPIAESKEPNIPDSTQANERQVLDPITHLPIPIHDVTNVELERIPPPPSTSEERHRAEATANQADKGATESDRRHYGVEQVVREVTRLGWSSDPGRDLDRARVQTAIVAGVTAGFGLVLWWFFYHLVGHRQRFSWLDLLVLPFGCCLLAFLVGASALFLKPFQTHPEQLPPPPELPQQIAENPQALIRSLTAEHPEDGPESASWLNSFLRSVWPIVNPALFTAVSDTLEDSLQASLPKLIRGVRVADIGQGTEPVRILCIRWLSPGEADEDVQGMKAEEGDFINLEVALAYRAKPTTSTGGLKGRSANLHLLMEFYISGGMMLPVWVELAGLLTTARLRIQLTPNPPFLAMMKVSLMGQPKITLNCTPLAKNFLNIMDIPGLSGWLQQNIDSVAGEYVAPKSVNLDLKSILTGAPRMDVDALGVLVVTVRRATGFGDADEIKVFKTGEDGRKGDTYVTLGWSKLGKFIWATRIVSKDGNPVWGETTAVLVSKQEIDAQESFRVQLWDADRFSADDLIGTIDISLSHLMNDSETLNHISVREDQFFTETGGDPVPGKLLWECGYFPKTTLRQHLEHKHRNYEEIQAGIKAEAERKLREAKTRDLLNQQQDSGLSYSQAEGQVMAHDAGSSSSGGVGGKDDGGSKDGRRSEVEQQKEEDLREKGDKIIASSRPTAEFPSGILSVRIEQISGLGVNRVRESGVREAEEGTDDDADDLPSAYCTVYFNHQRVYKTRTKMKSSNPFFDAGIEKFVRDWQDTTVIIAVRDNRMHEQSPVLGVVVLPLFEVFRDCSAFTHTLPIVGGIGYGRLRFSLIFRSVQVQLPRRLLGWDVGTLEILPRVYIMGDNSQGDVEWKEGSGGGSTFASHLAACRLVFRTRYGKDKMIPFRPKRHHSGARSQPNASGSLNQPSLHSPAPSSLTSVADAEAEWRQKKDKPIRLPVLKRYASCLHIQFRKRVLGPDLTPAMCMLWLKDIPDEDEVTVQLPIRRQYTGGGCANVKMSKSKDTDSTRTDAQGYSSPRRRDSIRELEEGDGDSSREGEVIPGMMLVVHLRFWHGLSGYHQKLANHDKNLEDMMEVLDCAEEQTDVSHDLLRERDGGEDSEEGEESEVDVDSADEDTVASNSSGKKRRHSQEETELSRVKELKKKESKQSFVADAKAQRKRPKETHRKHRGLMQWKAMRNMTWVGHNVEEKAERLGNKIKSGFRSQDRETGVEKEV